MRGSVEFSESWKRRCLRAPTFRVGAKVRFRGGAILKSPDFTQELPRKLLRHQDAAIAEFCSLGVLGRAHASGPTLRSGTIREAGYEHPHGFVKLETPGKIWLVVLAPPSRISFGSTPGG